MPWNRVDPVVPTLLRRIGREVDAAGAGIEGLAAGFGVGPRRRDQAFQLRQALQVVPLGHESLQERGTD